MVVRQPLMCNLTNNPRVQRRNPLRLLPIPLSLLRRSLPCSPRGLARILRPLHCAILVSHGRRSNDALQTPLFHSFSLNDEMHSHLAFSGWSQYPYTVRHVGFLYPPNHFPDCPIQIQFTHSGISFQSGFIPSPMALGLCLLGGAPANRGGGG